MRTIPACPATLISEPDGTQYELGETTVIPQAGETCAFRIQAYRYTGLVTNSEVYGGDRPTGAKIWAADLRVAPTAPG